MRAESGGTTVIVSRRTAGVFCDPPSAGRQPISTSAASRNRFIARNIRLHGSATPPSRHSFCASGVRMRTILIWFQSGGPFIAPLVLVGLVSLLLLLERTVYIVIRSKIHARPFIEKVISLTCAAKVEEA